MAESNVASQIGKLFVEFAKFGDSKSSGQQINLKNSDKWMKQANLFDKSFSTTDTGIAFSKFKVKSMDQKMFEQYITDLCKAKKMDYNTFVGKLIACGPPGTNNATTVAAMDVTSRLTDTAAYTGTHKERFDADGHGKGQEGREDLSAEDGYVKGYKNKDTYDKTHK